MHTESQAKELWCPLVRHEGEAAGSFNRGWSPSNPLNHAAKPEETSYLCNCIGSRCAAWRWERRRDVGQVPCVDRRAKAEPSRPTEVPSMWIFIPEVPGVLAAHWAEPERRGPPLGYCGMIGRGMDVVH